MRMYDIGSAIIGATLALAVFAVFGGTANESPLPVQSDECQVQIEGSNAVSKTRFAIENPEACGYAPVDFTDEEFVPKLPEVETVVIEN